MRPQRIILCGGADAATTFGLFIMKIQLGLLLLVVLFVSLSSVVFAQPPLSAVQSGEASPAAPTAEAVKKSWEGPFFGLGLGLGAMKVGTMSEPFADEWVESPLGGILPIRVRLGYGFSNSVVLYGLVGIDRVLGFSDKWVAYQQRYSYDNPYVEWTFPYGALGVMFRAGQSDYYVFFDLGLSVAREYEPFWENFSLNAAPLIRGGSGLEVHPGLFVEVTLAGTLRSSALVDLTFNYHFY